MPCGISLNFHDHSNVLKDKNNKNCHCIKVILIKCRIQNIQQNNENRYLISTNQNFQHFLAFIKPQVLYLNKIILFKVVSNYMCICFRLLFFFLHLLLLLFFSYNLSAKKVSLAQVIRAQSKISICTWLFMNNLHIENKQAESLAMRTFHFSASRL